LCKGAGRKGEKCGQRSQAHDGFQPESNENVDRDSMRQLDPKDKHTDKWANVYSSDGAL